MNMKDLLDIGDKLTSKLKAWKSIDLGDGWKFQKSYIDEEYSIHFNHIGGISISISGQRLTVYRYIGETSEEIYVVDDYKNKELKDVSELHYGVAEKLKQVFGY